MKPIIEEYRPSSLAEVCGQKQAVKVINRLQARGLGGRAFWFSGPSGTGKTTLARIVARLVADDICIDELDSGGLLPSRLNQVEEKWSGRALFGNGGHALIINEAHGLRKDTIRHLLTMLERLPSYVVVCFTTTKEGQQSLFDEQIDASPLMSRCVDIPMAKGEDTLMDFASRALKVARKEGLDGKPISAYVALVQEKKFNLRAVFQAIESGVMAD